MAVKQSPLNPTDQVPAAYQRYPITMHRGVHPSIQSRLAHSLEEEEEAAALGWSTQSPKIPDPVEPEALLTIEERISALEELILLSSGQPTISELIASERARRSDAEPEEKKKGKR